MAAAEKAEDENFSPPCLRRKPERYRCNYQLAFQAFSFGTWGIFKKLHMKGGAVLLFLREACGKRAAVVNQHLLQFLKREN
jgi:hypothetical protein